MDHPSKARRARLRLVLLAAGAAVLVAGLVVLALGALGGGSGKDRAKPSPKNSSPDPAGGGKKYTPATAPRVPVVKPEDSKNGIGTGFPHSPVGATSAAVSYWEDLSLIDDQAAERQLRTVAASPSDPAVRNRVSEVRKVREGVGLPPSGGPPEGMSFTTDVKAVLSRSLDDEGDVVQVWLVYDRYATSPENKADKDPLKDETDNLILTWKQGDWKVTEAPRWTRRSTEPRSYEPDSVHAFRDGWREVSDG